MGDLVFWSAGQLGNRTITRIPLPLPLRLGSVNAYLVHTPGGCVLVDTGSGNARAALEDALARGGCTPGRLDLVVLTHGDLDHIGNAAYLRQAYGARLAMHPADVGMAEQGDMFYNRTSANRVMRFLAPCLARLLGFPPTSRFTPDLLLEKGSDLLAYGLDARVLALPGHSPGSIGILTAGGDLFCGDLLENPGTPAPGSIVDDPAAARASVERLKDLAIETVYPGHGSPFAMAQFLALDAPPQP
jgi:hydroxyacylglutathione hydrolase